MKKIMFSKLHGQGNDFVIIDATENVLQGLSITPGQIARICDRHFGIGADGLIIVRNNIAGAGFFMDYYNQDGSVAEMCGNGIRCMAKFIYDKNLSRDDKLDIQTRAGLKTVQIIKDEIQGQEKIGYSNRASRIKVDMGSPVFEPSEIPVNIKTEELIFGYFAGNYELKLSDECFIISCVSMGNPHCVIFLDEDKDIKEIPIDKWGPEIENNTIFPKKTNVEFIKVLNDSSLEMRVWERGVGETLACGTGACASAVCATVLGKISSPSINVFLPGGNLKIGWAGKDCAVFLEGIAENVFEGQYWLA